MVFKHFRYLSLVVGLSAAPVFGASTEESLLAAFDAYRAGDPMKLSRHAKRLENHVLTPWIEYWRLSLRLEDASVDDVRKFLAAHSDTYVSELLRTEWLKVLGKRGEWSEFDRLTAHFGGDDLEIRCYAFLSRALRGDEHALNEGQAAIWLEPRELPEGCDKLANKLWEEERLSVSEVWQRVRVLFENGQTTAAKETLGYLPRAEAPDERALADAARHPKRLLQRLPKNLERRATREVVVLAAIRQARNDPEEAAEALDGALSQLPDADLRYLWGRVAYEGARQHHEDALKWYARAGDARLDDEQLAWKVRAALRRGHWQTVRDTIDRMSPEVRRYSAWTYWYGRALAAHGEETGSRAYYLRIAGQADYYGLLADEELGYVGTLPEKKYVPTDEEVEKAKREPGLARAMELIRVGMRTEGVKEWSFAIRNFDDARLLAAAELARRAEIYDRTIQTAERTQRTHNYTLRYPVPFRDVFTEYAGNHGLDEAWVLGLARQESRFIAEARSSAGAAGLMQLMPRTARFVASKIGMRRFRHRDVTNIETNVNLGSRYMKLVLDQLGHPVLASTAYNAGPSRARRWRDAKPLEGAIYIENIPFSETRDYVRKVMANSVFYSAVLQKQPTPLKKRLGIIPARDGSELIEDDELP
jgi:soluble lytic murein transglycosylase